MYVSQIRVQDRMVKGFQGHIFVFSNISDLLLFFKAE